MGTIVARPRKDGSVGYMAQIILMRHGAIAHRESKTFDRKPAAAAWLKKREAELAKPDAVMGARRGPRAPTLGDAIDQLLKESARAPGRTKAGVLKALKTYDIAALPCEAVDSPAIVKLAQELAEGRGPATVGNWLSHLSSVFAIARPAWGWPLDERAMSDGLVVARRLGLVAKSQARERRPTLDELDRILAHFEERRRRRSDSAPMVAITVFALFSARRQEEIIRIAWADLEAEGPSPRVLVRDMKDPAAKAGNHIWCDLPEPALRVAQAMPKRGPLIFPYGNDAVSAAFTRACAFLGIDDLHFHDLRHEGVSRLFEMGWSIPHAAAVSGHRSWSTLKRYAHLRQRGDRYDGWRWIDLAVEDAKQAAPPPRKRVSR
jgi:integrase